jgi:hypothetical protein
VAGQALKSTQTTPTSPAVQESERVGLEKKQQVLKKFPGVGKKGKNTLLLVLGSLFVVLAGVAAGWLLSGKTLGTSTSSVSKETEKEIKVSETEAGLEDESLFPDNAKGKLMEGGINGEGTYHLERPGGPQQNVYLTSTVIDLASFLEKEVEVWGETISGQKAGWLMDVGKIKVVE